MAAGPLQIAVRPYRASTPPELVRALEAIVADGMNGMANFQGRLSLLANCARRRTSAAKSRPPAVYQATLFAEAGGSDVPGGRPISLISTALLAAMSTASCGATTPATCRSTS